MNKIQLSYHCRFPWSNSTIWFSWVSSRYLCFQRHYSWFVLTLALCFIKKLVICADSAWRNALCTMSLSQLLGWSEGKQWLLRTMSYYTKWMLSAIVSLHSDPNCNLYLWQSSRPTESHILHLKLFFVTLNN